MSGLSEARSLEVAVIAEGDAPEWLAMRQALWPMSSASEHSAEMRDLAARSEFAAYMARDRGKPVGFAEVYIRPFANGCVSRPVPFLEGIWVAPDARGRGISRALLIAVERWCRSRGFAELGSDALIQNEASHRAHAAWGFAETERVVYFRKPLAEMDGS